MNRTKGRDTLKGHKVNACRRILLEIHGAMFPCVFTCIFLFDTINAIDLNFTSDTINYTVSQ